MNAETFQIASSNNYYFNDYLRSIARNWALRKREGLPQMSGRA